MKAIVFYIILISVLGGCKDVNEDEIIGYKKVNFSKADLPNPIEMHGKKLEFDQFLNPRHILVIDDHLIVAENGLEDIFYIYDLDNLDFLKSIGSNGVGPGEITACANLQKGDQQGEFWADDAFQKTYLKFDVNSDSKLAKDEVKQGESLTMAVQMAHSSDSTLMTILMHGKKMFVDFSFDGDTINTYSSWDRLMKNERDLPMHVITNVLQGTFTSSWDRKYFALSGIFKDYIEILNRETGNILSIRGPANIDPEFSIDYSRGFETPIFEKGWSTQYNKSHLGKSSIFSLYYGKSYEEVYGNNNGVVNIFEFDYDGNIINNYLINYPLISFSVDEKRKKIYGISKDEDPNVVVFEYGGI
jgi:hypothetical protein